jgi:hypothetical protein
VSAVTISAFARKRGRMTTSSQENDWAVWMRAAMTGDASAYRQLLVSLALALVVRALRHWLGGNRVLSRRYPTPDSAMRNFGSFGSGPPLLNLDAARRCTEAPKWRRRVPSSRCLSCFCRHTVE